jgi:hypothetical protein
MDTSSGTKERTAADWQAFVEGQGGSGKSVTEYCREQGVGPHRFYYWRKRGIGGPAGKVRGGFVECRLTGSRAGLLVLDCPSGYRIHVSRDCDVRLLEQTLKVLARC